MGGRPNKQITTPDSRDRRVDFRADIDGAVRVAITSVITGDTVHGWARNLSRGGMLVECKEQLPQESRITLQALARAGDTVCRLRLKGWIARSSDTEMGIQFADPEPAMAEQIKRLLDWLTIHYNHPPPEPRERVDR